MAKIAPHSHGVINPPGEWDFFLSHTQRNGEAKTLALELYAGMREKKKRCWLDVKMDKCDGDAMKEGVHGSQCVVAIITAASRVFRPFSAPIPRVNREVSERAAICAVCMSR